jgi:large-conductance mechanosensitive channel
MRILKYWRFLATVVIVALASLVNNVVSGIDGTVSGAVAVNQMNGGDAGYIAAHVAATSSSYLDIIIAMVVVALMIFIWTPVVKQWFHNSK